MNYPVKRMIVPILLGKATFLGVMAYLSHYAYLTAADYVGVGGIDPSILVLLVILVVVFMVYWGRRRAGD
jgi:hypothetical protein